MNKSSLKIAGLLAVAVAVTGATLLISRGTLPGGVSADLGDIAAGEVVVISQTDYQAALDQLGDYFTTADKTTQDNIVLDVVKILENAKK